MSSGYEDEATNSKSSQSNDKTPEVNPKLQSHSKNSSDNEDDAFSSGEEEMMQRMAAMRTSQGSTSRRLSSLDVYLLRPREESVSYVLKGKGTLKDVINEVKEFEQQEANKVTEEERRQLASDRKRAEVMMARLQKNDDKRRESVLRDLTEAQSEKIRNRSQVKKFDGLTSEKRKRLKELLMQKAKEEFRNERKEQMRAKEDYLQKVCPPLNMNNMDDAQLVKLIKDLYARVKRCQEQKLEWEQRLQVQTEEIHSLIQEIQEKQGRFSVPVLRKVKRK
ncbi:unnamed protein product [Hymenolepis diminuta]|uniref:Uncharacterized protein n=1 Tax=Hymenolepis diminuta TaxID=6216 RepID=A0A564YFF0_HYMDI|nr:unnamed protein product [Hymenolepis diminuta]